MPPRNEAFAAYAKPKTVRQNEQRFLRSKPVGGDGPVATKTLQQETLQALSQYPPHVAGRSYVDMVQNQRAINSKLYTTQALQPHLPPTYAPVSEATR